MPLPTPRPNEGKAAFLQRCLSDDNIKQEFPQPGQAVAVCAQQYDQSKG